MIKKLIEILFITFFLITLAPIAQASRLGFPRGCEAIGFEFQNNDLVLNQNREQNIYFIQNISNATVYLLHHEKKQVFMSLAWQARLNKNMWATIAISEENMNFNCNHISKGQIKLINCANAIRICQYPRVKFTLSNLGTYWIAKNKTLRNSMSKAIKKGILLSW